MTIEEFRAMRVAPALKKRNKYGATKSGGYDSKKEHKRANELKLMQRAGLITNLREQVKYVLIPTQRDAAGNLLEKSVLYRADFVYDKDGALLWSKIQKGCAHQSIKSKTKIDALCPRNINRRNLINTAMARIAKSGLEYFPLI